MKIMVLYSTVEGHTAKIAKLLADGLEQKGNEVFVTEPSDQGYCDPGKFDAAILCAPIHIGQYPSDFVSFIQNRKSALQDIPTGLVTVSLSIASNHEVERKEAEGYPQMLIDKTGWTPGQTYNAAGALKYVEYDFFKRWIIRRIANAEGGPIDTSQDHELTDWDDLNAFAASFLMNTTKELVN
ncbi:MAG: flavodoxin domain-containing protein [Rhizobiaceae bacterium]